MDAKKVNGSGNGSKGSNEWRVKVGLAEMLKGGVIMDVTNAEQAKIAEKAGACAVMDGDDSGDGQSAHRAFRGSGCAASAGSGFYRRERSADAGR